MCRHDGHRISQATVLRLLLEANYQRERRQLAARRKAATAGEARPAVSRPWHGHRGAARGGGLGGTARELTARDGGTVAVHRRVGERNGGTLYVAERHRASRSPPATSGC